MRCAALAVSLTLGLAAPGFAQPGVDAPAPATPKFMSRYDFHLTAKGIGQKDPRFTWDTYWGGDLDLVDYVAGRASVLVDYEAVLGGQFRPFDPNQSYYTLEVSSSLRLKGIEVAGVFHHVSRHLSDRPKRFGIAWNVAGVRAMRRLAAGPWTVDARADFGRVVARAWVDYTWIADLDLVFRRPLTDHVGGYGMVYMKAFGVDHAVQARTMQTGGRLEAGVRLNGGAGALELFVGVERRVDADSIDRLPLRWAFAGFRLVNK